jgi:IS605 OrfB family transposase
MAGEYEACASKIVKNKGKYYINLTYAMLPCLKVGLDPQKVLGVDRGYNTAAACAVNYNDYTRKYIGGREILKNKMRYERILKQERMGATVNTRGGHGRKPKVKVSDSIRYKKSDYTELVNRNIAKQVVDFAISNGCGVIHLEDLSGFRQVYASNRYLGEWTYYQLQTFIEQKAKQEGVKVLYVDPKYTSQTCSKCGYQDKGNRPKGDKGAEYFKCLKCGYEANADYNAARNIAMKEPLATE